MSVHSFWDAEIVDRAGRKLQVNVHAVGLDANDPKAIEDHLKRHNFHTAKTVKVTPKNGLVNFHGYPVQGPGQNYIHPTHNIDGEKVDAISGALLGPDGKPIQVTEEDLAVPVQHPNPAKQPDVRQVPEAMASEVAAQPATEEPAPEESETPETPETPEVTA